MHLQLLFIKINLKVIIINELRETNYFFSSQRRNKIVTEIFGLTVRNTKFTNISSTNAL